MASQILAIALNFEIMQQWQVQLKEENFWTIYSRFAEIVIRYTKRTLEIKA